MNTFELSRAFFDYCINNPDKIKTGNIALYYFIVDHCNRLGWPDKLGLPSHYAMTVLGIARYNTYKDYLNVLVDCGFINIVQLSKNQYTATVISINGAKLKKRIATDEATDEAMVQQPTKHRRSNRQSDSSIIKPINSIKPKTLNLEEQMNSFKLEVWEFRDKYTHDMLAKFYNHWSEPNPSKTKMKYQMEKTWSLEKRLITWKDRHDLYNAKFKATESPKVGGGSGLPNLTNKIY